MHDPFITLHHLFSKDGAHRSTPLILRPEDIAEMCDGEVFLKRGGSYTVREKAEEMKKLVLEKMHENRQAETLGK
jgi:hypothetical protein